MKKLFLFALLFLIATESAVSQKRPARPPAFSTAEINESAKITPLKRTYRRPRKAPEHKRTFAITFPIVSGLKNRVLEKRIESALSHEKAFDFKIRDEINNLWWLDEAGFEVAYNKNGILDVGLTVEGSGAYPSGYTKHVVVNLQTGNQARPADMFINLSALVKEMRKKQLAEIEEAKAEIKQAEPELVEMTDQIFAERKLTTADLNFFSVSDAGVTFYYEWDFPQFARSMEPAGNYFFSFDELKPFIRRNGLLARLAS